MTDAVIVSACRTAIGTAFKGTLTETTAFDLADAVVGESLARTGLGPADVDDVILGETMYGGGVVARADDAEPIEGTPDLDLSADVFPETPGGEASAAAPETPDVAPEAVDESIEADAAAPDEPGPGDSEGEAPAAPAEAETEAE